MMRIGITDSDRPDSKVAMYEDWLRITEPALEFVRLTPQSDNIDTIEGLDGIVLTGGPDIHPKFYGRDDLFSRCEDVNVARDVFELRVVERSLEHDKPILAVCRGHQLLNVALGGSLLTDLPSAGFSDHRPKTNSMDVLHGLRVHPHSLLYFAARTSMSQVNSSHHQAVDRLGTGLTPTGFSPDGVIEAMEWSSKDGMPFLLSVQWHPERMPKDSLSHNVASLFMRDVQRVHHSNAHLHN